MSQAQTPKWGAYGSNPGVEKNAFDVGENEIKYDGVRVVIIQQAESLKSGAGNPDVITVELEKRAQTLSDRSVIFDEEYTGIVCAALKLHANQPGIRGNRLDVPRRF